jgi:hypothetical protein
MKLSGKTLPSLALLCFLGTIVGALAWAVLERAAGLAGLAIDLSVGPVGFDLEVISFGITVNPGSFLGLAAGALLFRAL